MRRDVGSGRLIWGQVRPAPRNCRTEIFGTGKATVAWCKIRRDDLESEMTQPAKVQEPSMEEILASIRRIIADDEAKPPVADAKPVAAERPAAPPPPAKAEKPAAPAPAPKPAMSDIPPSKIPPPPAPKAVASAPPPPAPPPPAASASNNQDDIDALLNGLD